MSKTGRDAREDPQSPVNAAIPEYAMNAAFEQRQEETLAVLKKKRGLESRAKGTLEKAIMAHAHAEEAMARLYQMKVYEIQNSPEWPAALESGGETEGWDSIVVEHLLSSDEDWAEAMSLVYKLQEAAAAARAAALNIQADVANLHEELGVLKNRGITRAALMFASLPFSVSNPIVPLDEPIDGS